MGNSKKEQTPTEDAVLLMFLSLAENDGIEAAITLNIQGVIVTGLLIGSRAYYDGITESSLTLKDDTMSKIIAKRFSDLRDEYLKQKQEQGDKKDDEEAAVTYIHLKNAKYHQPAMNASTSWWRGKISSIDSFSFDSLI
ncbi:hypothetical protein M4D55_04020 [Metabacillus idriensis]|uniref:Gas vesicle protein GvpU n=1 Tax=Metabacillus idriensis TaxID=324768 RepID=A0A6I2M4H8_9BACI|nr:hypothetical protein [Metabacillus idriensis]MCM3594955.1 hypothetical protein [Metabacillus idriensis]MRX53025.1 hypothetical protein [Metabacillus idriensis]OHR67108.1 hypothetical protein HMPREF3291_11560 [Bacillus sp. HMSC76G11]